VIGRRFASGAASGYHPDAAARKMERQHMPGAASHQGPSPTGDPRLDRVSAAIHRRRSRPDALLEVLHVAQRAYGYLPPHVLWHVARGLKLPPSRVCGVATFYHLFTLHPQGEHACVVCLGTACHIHGAQRVVQALQRDTGLEMGQTSPDGRLSLGASRCLGACGIAPVVLYDGQMAARQTPDAAIQRVKTWQTRGTS
jgi:bidirectional [NiFe] hydrogenase diaphorase subunit